MVQEAYDTHPLIRKACDRCISAHAVTLLPDIEAAVRKYGIRPGWTVKASPFTRRLFAGLLHPSQGSAWVRGCCACIDHLYRYVELLFHRRPSSERTQSQPHLATTVEPKREHNHLREFPRHLRGCLQVLRKASRRKERRDDDARAISLPSPLSPDWKNAVLHARITIGNLQLWAADIPKAQPMRSAYLTLSMGSDLEAERAFSALSDGGQVLMPMEETFFASRFGQVRGILSASAG